MIDDDLIAVLVPVFAPTAVIFANENGPRPLSQYVTLRIESAHKLPEHTGVLTENGPIPALGSRPTDAHRTGQLEIQCFGPGSFDVLDIAMQRLSEEVHVMAANARELAFGTSSDVTNEPALRDGLSFEPRAIVSLPFAYTRRTVETLPMIETLNAVVEISDLPDLPIHVAIVDN